MLDYISKSRMMKNNETGTGYVVAVPNEWGAYVPLYGHGRGHMLGRERKAIRSKILQTLDGRGYVAGFHIYKSLEGAEHLCRMTSAPGAVVLKAAYRGVAVCGAQHGHRVIVAKYRTLLEEEVNAEDRDRYDKTQT